MSARTPSPEDDDPVTAVIAHPATRHALVVQALCRLNRWLADQPRAKREQEAEEIADESLKRAWEHRSQYRSERASVMAWIAGFVPNILAEHCRSLRKVEQPPIQFRHHGQEGTIEMALVGWNVDDLLNRVPAAERNLVRWACIEELTHREIGERLQISEDCSRQRLRRVLAKLERISKSVLGEGCA